MEFTYDNFILRIEDDMSDGMNVNLFLSTELNSPLLYLKLSPLSEVNTELDSRDQVRDIPRHLFQKGDFYQSSVHRYASLETFLQISLLATVHDILIANRNEVKDIKRIFSSSLNRYTEETFFTDNAINFWNMQLAKSGRLPVSYFKDDKRYFLTLNK